MRLTNLQLEQFRSYERLEHAFDIDEGIQLIVGPNAAGKTNVLEAIALLSLTKSCQGTEEADLLQWEKEYYRVRATAQDQEQQECTFEITSQIAPRKKRVCFRNDVQCSIGEMVGSLPTVIFLPQDLDLFQGAPQHRRRFLDQLLCQVSPEYLQSLSHYGKILKQRNSLLRRIAEGRAGEGELALWDTQLSLCGADVTLKRLELIEMLQCTLLQELQSLGESWSDAQLVYTRKSTQRDQAELQTEIVSLLETARKRDILLQSTSIGPHREDWSLQIEERNLPSFASRGQQRTAVLALVFLQVSFMELRRGEKPVVLLDDVFSELDDAHQSCLLKNLSGHQVFITTTHIPQQLHGATVWEMKH